MEPRSQFKDSKVIKRFLKKIEISENDCWIWKAAKNDRGYGKFRIGNKLEMAHRASWMIYHDDIIYGYLVCHKCDNPLCVNPDHLFTGTQSDNMADMHRKNRWISGIYKGHLKLNATMARMIKYDDLPQAKIAEKWGVSRALVSNIKNGKTWKYV